MEELTFKITNLNSIYFTFLTVLQVFNCELPQGHY